MTSLPPAPDRDLDDDADIASPPRAWHRSMIWSLAGMGVLASLFIAMIWLDSGGGQSFLMRRLAMFETDSGLSVRIGKVRGSLFNAARLSEVELRDPQGTFAVIDNGFVRWRPLALLRGDLTIESIDIDRARWLRRPELRPTPPDDELLPDGRIEIGSVRVRALSVAPAVAGRLFDLTLNGRALIDDHKIDSNATILARDSADRAVVRLLADPRADRFDLKLDVVAPANGLLASLSDLPAAVRAQAAGTGSFTRWRGNLTASLDAQPLLNVGLQLDRGTLAGTGRIEPAPALPAHLKQLVGLSNEVTFSGRIVDRVIDATARLQGPGAVLDGAGAFDTVSGRLQRGRAVLTDPSAQWLATWLPDLTGSALKLQVDAAGPLDHPALSGRLTADRLAYQSFAATGIVATGGNTADADGPIDVSVEARAATTGQPALDPYLRQIAGTARLRRTEADVVVDQYRLRSAAGQLDGAGRYDASAREMRLTVQSGSVTVATADYGRVPIGVEGRVLIAPGGQIVSVLTARPDVSKATLADTAKRAIGPRAAVSGQVRVQGDQLQVSDLVVELAAGRFTGALVRAPGALRGQLAGTLVRWDLISPGLAGTAPVPIVLTLAGSPQAPTITADGKLSRLSLGGIDLTNVNARVEPDVNQGLRAAIKGDSPLGPLALSGRVVPGGPTLAVEQVTGTVGPLLVSGGANRAVTGNWTGDIALRPGRAAGSDGLSADLTLGERDGEQTAQLMVRGREVRQRWNQQTILADSLSLEASGVFGKVWRISGKGDARGIGTAQWQADTLSAQGVANADGLRITGQLAGDRGVPYTLAGTLTRASEAPRGATPPLVLAALTGRVGTLGLQLQQPVQWTTTRDGWDLTPARLTIGGGTTTVTAQNRRDITSGTLALANVDLTALELLAPGLGLSGRADGTARYALRADRLTDLDATLDIKRVRRAGVFQASLPLDAGVKVKLEANTLAATIDSAVNRQSAGQSTVTLQRVGQRSFLDGAQLGGTLRWAGPVEAVWGLLGYADHDLRGRARIEAALAGQVDDPQLRGSVSLEDGRYESLGTGVVVSDAVMRGRLDGARFVLDSARGKMNRTGTVTATGSADLSAARGFPAKFDIALDKAGLVQRDDLELIASGPLLLTHGPDGGRIAGKFAMQRARLLVGPRPGETIPDVAVRERGRPAAAPGAAEASMRPRPVRTVRPWALDLTVSARNRVFVQGLGLDSEWSGQLGVKGTVVRPLVTGTLSTLRGTYEFAGRRFTLERGTLTFDGEERINPTIAIAANGRFRDFTGIIDISGRAAQPQIAFRSNPPLPQDEVLSRILFGTDIASLSPLEAVQLAGAVASLSNPGGRDLNVLNQVRRMAGIDRLRVVPSDTSRGIGTAISGGKYLTDRVYVELASDGRGYTATTLEVELTRSLSLLSQIATLGGTNVAAKWSRSY
jgi:translocation and assembly module TamB